MTPTRLLLTAALAICLVPAASAQGLSLDLSATADVTGATEHVYAAKATATGLVDEVQAKAEGTIATAKGEVDALHAEIDAEAHASAEEAAGFGEKVSAAFQNAINGLKGFAASLSARLSVG